MSNPDSPQDLINRSPMSSAQIGAICICVLLNMLDGYDILVMSFTAAPVAKEWGLTNSELGLLLSSGLFGMTLGALFLASYADTLGRRKMIIICASIMAGGMLFSGYTSNYEQLAILRFITGIGIGAMIASLNTIVAEFSSDQRRTLAVSLLQTGNPIGGVLGGLLAVFLIDAYGWRSAFIIGGIITLIILPLVILKLPESISFLLKKGSESTLKQINKTLISFGHQPIKELPDNQRHAPQKTGFKSLFEDGKAASTLLLWLSFFMVMFSFYFIMSWTPKLLVESGLSVSNGISGSIILNIGGILGAPVLGYFAAKRGLQKLLIGYMTGTALLMILFGNLTANFIPALIVALFMGFFLFGSIIGLYALAPSVYASSNRATGTGVAIGVGRIGAVLAPMIAGFTLDLNLSTPMLFFVFSLPLIACMIAQQKIRTFA